MRSHIENVDRIARQPLVTQLTSAAEVDLLEQFQMSWSWFVLVELLGKLERLLKTALLARTINATPQLLRRISGSMVVFVLLAHGNSRAAIVRRWSLPLLYGWHRFATTGVVAHFFALFVLNRRRALLKRVFQRNRLRLKNYFVLHREKGKIPCLCECF